MWKTTLTGEGVNLNNVSGLFIKKNSNVNLFFVDTEIDYDGYRLAKFDTREQAEEFIENLVDQMNAPMNFPAKMQSLTKDFLDKVTKEKLTLPKENQFEIFYSY